MPPGQRPCRARSSVRHAPGRSRPDRRWDDLRLAGLKLIFLIVSRAVSLLGLSRREAWWRDAEILMLRHQLAVARRERPGARARLTWPDRALLALLAGTLPIDRLAAMQLIITPGTILRWHRDIVRRRWSRRSRQGRSRAPGNAPEGPVGGATACPGERVVGLPPHPRRAGRARRHRGAVHGLADPQERRHRSRAPPGGTRLGRVPAIPGAGDPGAGLLHRRPAQRNEGLRPCRYRARHPPGTRPRSHPAPGPGMGGPAGPEPAHRPGGCRDAGEVRPA